jgi:hypothetical protein
LFQTKAALTTKLDVEDRKHKPFEESTLMVTQKANGENDNRSSVHEIPQ